jgi:hypothetical protein
MLAGEDGYYHHRIKRILDRAGFTVWRLERDEVHPVWVGWIRPGNTGISRDQREAANQLRRILTKAALKIKPGVLTVLDRRKDMIRFTFLLPWGAPGF